MKKLIGFAFAAGGGAPATKGPNFFIFSHCHGFLAICSSINQRLTQISDESDA